MNQNKNWIEKMHFELKNEKMLLHIPQTWNIYNKCLIFLLNPHFETKKTQLLHFLNIDTIHEWGQSTQNIRYLLM